MAKDSNWPTIGILYPGELGSTLGRLLIRGGFRVVTTLEGRSARTARLCAQAGLCVVDSFEEVVERADWVFSVVPPAGAIGVALRFSATPVRAARRRLYVDLNAIAPIAVHQIGDLIADREIEFVDGAIHGLAARLPDHGTVYLSGPAAAEVGAMLGRVFRVKVLGEAPGQASALKMLIAGMSKGIIALFLEMALAARRAGLLEELLACYGESYAGVMAVVERLLPTYPQHAVRRGDELAEVEQTLRTLDLQPAMVAAAQQLIAQLGCLNLAGDGLLDASRNWSVRDVIEAAGRHNLLQSSSRPVVASDGNRI